MLRLLPGFEIETRVYINKVFTLDKSTLVLQDPSRILVIKRDGPYRVLQVRIHIVTVDFHGIQIVVSIDCTMLARPAKKAVSPAEEKRRKAAQQQNKASTGQRFHHMIS